MKKWAIVIMLGSPVISVSTASYVVPTEPRVLSSCSDQDCPGQAPSLEPENLPPLKIYNASEDTFEGKNPNAKKEKTR